MRLWTQKIVFFLSLLLLASPSYALTTAFSDRTAWDGAMGSQTTLDFTGFSSGGTNPTYRQYSFPLSYNGVVFNDTFIGYHPGRLFGIGPAYPTDAPYHTTEYLNWDNAINGNMLIITLPGMVSGIGFDFGMFSGSVSQFIIDLGNGESFSVYSASNAYSFFGAVTDTPFLNFSIRAGSQVLGWPTIDNLSYGTSGSTGGGASAVPEPSTLLLLGSGIAGLGLTMLRKFRKNA